ncbi:MAG: acyl-CoA dehydratase activase [Bacillota bacterium]
MEEVTRSELPGPLPNLGLDIGTFTVKAVLAHNGIVAKVSLPTAGRPLQNTLACIDRLREAGHDYKEFRVGVTGANAHLFAQEAGIEPILEIKALCDGLTYSGIRCDAVLSLGHENMYYLEIGPDGEVEFFNRNGQCAAGSGAFWYQQATRLGYDDRDLAELALSDDSPVKISGRCAVFAKSDMTHAINEGATQSAVSAGLAKTLADIVMSNVALNRAAKRARIVAVGGVANNKAVMKYLLQHLDGSGSTLDVPGEHEFLFALGAAQSGQPVNLESVRPSDALNRAYVPQRPLPRLLRDRVHYMPETMSPGKSLDTSTVFLGVDCGSVSTKCVLLDAHGQVIGGIYLPTSGRPALQVLELVKRVREEYAGAVAAARIVACTTGSGRFLSQRILNAEYAVDEITCQAEGVKRLCGDKGTFSIIEIGGEDSKFLQLRDGALYDYNMNPVCAAGTGTFLENLTALLGINIKGEFSEQAFTAEYAIDLGDTCTLLSQSALASSASQGLPLQSQLASLAYSSARNYITKTAENRAMDGKVVFTGATAKNHALAAAFAAEIQKDIVVPPHPELTGALGAALMAKAFDETGMETSYTFKDLRHLNEFAKSRRKCTAQCEHEHNCTLDVIKFSDGTTFLYGDRCGRYSGIESRRFARREDLPDYVQRRNQVFYRAAGEPLEDGPTVGVARAGPFFDLYPFWAGFFRELGARVVLSPDTTEAILEQGKRYLDSEMCYPVEVLVGHYEYLHRSNLDYIFVPEPVDMEPLPWATRWPRSFTCPLMQTIRGTVTSSLDLPENKVLYAQLNYRKGEGVVRKQLREVAQRLLGSDFREERLSRAVNAAYLRQAQYNEAMEKESRLAIEALRDARPEGSIVAVFLGRPYTVYDVEVSKRSLSFARDVGVLALPQDYLLSYTKGWYEGRVESDLLGSREEFDGELASIIQKMDNIYPGQVQKMLSAAIIARYLNRKNQGKPIPILHTILQDPFMCGPNAMLRHYLGMVSNSLRLTMDEHTAPAGMITRLEAFKNTSRSRKAYVAPTILTSESTTLLNLGGKTILIPEPTHHARVFGAMLERFGVDARMLPRSPDRDLSLARKYVNGDECLPMIQNVQDFLDYLQNGRVDLDRTVFLQGWACGPCRYGLYAPVQSLLLNKAGYGERMICSAKLADAVKRFGLVFAVGAYDGTVALDALYKMLHMTRPYELEPGSSEAIFEEYSHRLTRVLAGFRCSLTSLATGSYLEPLESLVREAAARFKAVPVSGQRRPRIVVAGEFYVRLDDRCNQDIIYKIERAGGEVSLSPASELFAYTAHINHEEGRTMYRKTGEFSALVRQISYGMLEGLALRDEHRIHRAAGETLAHDHEPPPKELRALSRRYVSDHYGGEPPMTIGRTCALAHRGTIHGAIFVAPFTCLPGSVVEAQMGALRRDLGIPVVATYYDGKENPTREEIIRGLVFQARQRLA